jgi:hypothetical protein
VRIDQTHKNWFIGSVVILLVAVIIYIPYDRITLGGAAGGTVIGIIYGSVGFAFMIFAGLLSLRKRFPVWRMGRAQSWMRGHLWLGLISYPIIFLHSGFSFGHGALTFWMMVLFTVVIVSGLVGAALQHYMPRMVTQMVPMETIYGDSAHVLRDLQEEAERIVADVCGPVVAMSATAASASGMSISTLVQVMDKAASAEMQRFYEQEMLPYLKQAGARSSVLANTNAAAAIFKNLRTLLPATVHEALSDLENICYEKRQIDLQARLHRILHGWLFVHIPLSYALLVMGAIHAVVALRY